MTQCIEFKGSITKSGYGMQYSPETMQSARSHRVAYCQHHKLKLSDIKGKMVLHTCDNRPCINPEHLYLGTHQDNMDDKVSRDRSHRGRDTTFSKLNEEDVLAIRAKYQKGVAGRNQPALAKEYGVSQPTISKIVLRRDWSWI